MPTDGQIHQERRAPRGGVLHANGPAEPRRDVADERQSQAEPATPVRTDGLR